MNNSFETIDLINVRPYSILETKPALFYNLNHTVSLILFLPNVSEAFSALRRILYACKHIFQET